MANAYDSATLTTIASVQKYEREIQDDDTKIEDKRDLAKSYLRMDISKFIKNQGVTNNGALGQEYIDTLLNPEIFSNCSDLLTLYFYFKDIAKNSARSGNNEKAEDYKERYNDELGKASAFMSLDLNRNGEADVYENQGNINNGIMYRG